MNELVIIIGVLLVLFVILQSYLLLMAMLKITSLKKTHVSSKGFISINQKVIDDLEGEITELVAENMNLIEKINKLNHEKHNGF